MGEINNDNRQTGSANNKTEELSWGSPTESPQQYVTVEKADEDASWWGSPEEKPLPIKKEAYKADRQFYRDSIKIVGATLLISVGGCIVLQAYDKEIPQMLVAIGSAALGIFAAIFNVNTKS